MVNNPTNNKPKPKQKQQSVYFQTRPTKRIHGTTKHQEVEPRMEVHTTRTCHENDKPIKWTKTARTTEKPNIHANSSKFYEQCKQRGRLQRHLDENTPKHLSLGPANLMPKASRQPRKETTTYISNWTLQKYMAPKPKL